jgi:hypothetical protein
MQLSRKYVGTGCNWLFRYVGTGCSSAGNSRHGMQLTCPEKIPKIKYVGTGCNCRHRPLNM